MTVHWHEQALEEYAEAAVYYERQVEDLGERFIGQVEAAVAKLLAAPLMPRIIQANAAESVLSSFPAR